MDVYLLINSIGGLYATSGWGCGLICGWIAYVRPLRSIHGRWCVVTGWDWPLEAGDAGLELEPAVDNPDERQ